MPAPRSLRIEDARWHRLPDGSPGCMPVHLAQADSGQHLVVEAANWANALEWGAQAALAAYWQLATQLQGELRNPCDEGGLRLWVIRPGFPREGEPLWQEPFGYYREIARNAALVYELHAQPGTAKCMHGARPLGLGEAMQLWDQQVTLLHPAAYRD